jgi:regulatory protein
VDADVEQERGRVAITARHVEWGRRAALHYLERWASSEANLARVLKRKLRRRASLDPDRWALAVVDVEALVAATLASCRDLGLLDDRAYAQTKVAGGRRRGHSASRIRSTMAAKGVPREIAEDAVGTGAEADDERAALVFARKRRLGPFRRTEGEVDGDCVRREIATLCRQGFGFGLARAVAAMDRETAESRLAGDQD